jgi:hypothetical protein
MDCHPERAYFAREGPAFLAMVRTSQRRDLLAMM